MSTGQPGYIPNSRSTRRAYRGMLNLAAQLHVEIEPRWRESFGHFLNDVGFRPENTILRRRDNHRGFFADNCMWIVPPVVIEPAAG